MYVNISNMILYYHNKTYQKHKYTLILHLLISLANYVIIKLWYKWYTIVFNRSGHKVVLANLDL